MRTDWTVRGDIEEAKRDLREAGGDDHYYGPWSGGSKASGGSAGAAGTKEQRKKDMGARVGKENVGKETSLTRKLKAKGKANDKKKATTATKSTEKAGGKAPEKKKATKATEAGPKQFDTPAQGNAWAKENMAPTFKGAQKRTATDYTGGNYYNLNNYHRGRRPPYRKPAETASMDKLISGHTTPATLQTSRTVSSSAFPDGLAGLKPGATFSDGGYTSLNLSKKGVTPSAESKRNITMNVTVPKGKNAVYLGTVSAYTKQEAEIVLPRNSSFKVTSVKQSGGRWVIDAVVE